MRKLALAIAFVLGAFGVAPASAGGSNPDIICDACLMFKQLQQQTPHYVAPSPPVIRQANVAPSGNICGWVLDKRPTPVVLRKGRGNTGGGILGWDASGWKASAHYPGFVEKYVCFPASRIVGIADASLCGEFGWQQAMLKGVFDNSSPADPFCIAGSTNCPSHLK